MSCSSAPLAAGKSAKNAMSKASFQFDSGVLRRSLLDGDYKELSMTSRHAIKAAA